MLLREETQFIFHRGPFRKWKVILSGPHKFNGLFKGSGFGLRSRVRALAVRVMGWRIKTASTAYMCHVSGEKNSRKGIRAKPKHRCSEVWCRSLRTPELQDYVMFTAVPNTKVLSCTWAWHHFEKPREANRKHSTQADRQTWNRRTPTRQVRPWKEQRRPRCWPDLLWTRSGLCSDLLHLSVNAALWEEVINFTWQK